MRQNMFIPLNDKVDVRVQYKRTVPFSFSKNCIWTFGNGNKVPCTNGQNRAALADANPCFWQDVTPFHVNGMHQGVAQSGGL